MFRVEHWPTMNSFQAVSALIKAHKRLRFTRNRAVYMSLVHQEVVLEATACAMCLAESGCSGCKRKCIEEMNSFQKERTNQFEPNTKLLSWIKNETEPFASGCLGLLLGTVVGEKCLEEQNPFQKKDLSWNQTLRFFLEKNVRQNHLYLVDWGCYTVSFLPFPHGHPQGKGACEMRRKGQSGTDTWPTLSTAHWHFRYFAQELAQWRAGQADYRESTHAMLLPQAKVGSLEYVTEYRQLGGFALFHWDSQTLPL